MSVDQADKNTKKEKRVCCDTMTIEKFEVMNAQELAAVEGGSKISAGDLARAGAICTASGACYW
ncbi:Blp family class II bacteriocin [Streptococcus macacae]|nr:Blp family class II bacteriocin [Streptococcus macacae]